MKTIPTTASVAYLIVLVVGLAAGCSSGSPPSQVPITVEGTVRLLEAPNTGVQNVGIQLEGPAGRFPSGNPAITDQNGVYRIENVLAPADYSIRVTLPQGSNLRIAGELPSTIKVDPGSAPGGVVRIATIYLTASPPPAYQ